MSIHLSSSAPTARGQRRERARVRAATGRSPRHQGRCQCQLAPSARRHSIRSSPLPRRRPPCRTRSPGPGVPEAASAVSRGGTGWHTKGG